MPQLTDNESNGKFMVKVNTLKLIMALLKDHESDTKISMESFLFILTRCFVGNENVKDLHHLITNFNLDKPENMKKYEENKDKFNMFHNEYRDKLEKNGVDYFYLVDFLSNFCDENLQCN